MSDDPHDPAINQLITELNVDLGLPKQRASETPPKPLPIEEIPPEPPLYVVVLNPRTPTKPLTWDLIEYYPYSPVTKVHSTYATNVEAEAAWRLHYCNPEAVAARNYYRDNRWKFIPQPPPKKKKRPRGAAGGLDTKKTRDWF